MMQLSLVVVRKHADRFDFQNDRAEAVEVRQIILSKNLIATCQL